MLTISNNLVTTTSYTPAWIKSERYLYCENFAQDLTGVRHANLLASLKRLLHR